MNLDVSLIVNGEKYQGWTDVSVKRSVKAISGEFKLSVTDNWGDVDKVFFIEIGDEAQVKIGDEVLVTGYVEELQNSIDANSHTVSVSGRDKTGDLVDCSAVYGNKEIKNADLTQIAKYLVEPFGLKVIAETDVGEPFKSFVIKTGETVFEAIERAARHRAVLITSDGLGNVVIAKLGEKKADGSLIEGKNFKKASLSIDTKQRFSEYDVKAQMKGTDETHGKNASQIKGRATDEVMKRYRPLIVIAEQQATAAEAQKRAEWEAAYRAANGSKLSVTVQGFDQTEDGKLWKLNEMVYFESKTLSLAQEFLIADIEYKISNSEGRTTTMTLQKPDAFIPKPNIEKKGKSKGGGDPMDIYEE